MKKEPQGEGNKKIPSFGGSFSVAFQAEGSKTALHIFGIPNDRNGI